MILFFMLAVFPIVSISSPINAFDTWAGLAQGGWQSPACFDQAIKESWTGPDGKSICLAVRQPVASNSVNITIPPITGDARPVFEAAIAKARADKINAISLSPGTYTFLSTDSTGQHLLISKAKDLTIEGNGASLIFAKNLNGITIRQSQRVRLQNIKLSYSLHTTSFGTIDGSKQLVIDQQYPVSATDSIYQIAELDVDGHFIPGGVRIITPPGKELPAYIGNQSYTYSGFSKVKAGSRFLVIHQWYGGSAIKIDGDRDSLMTEDVTFSGIAINSTPGMAVAVTGLKRGFAFIDSVLDGPSWDGIHISSGGGDIMIQRNRFSMLGDDAGLPAMELIRYPKSK